MKDPGPVQFRARFSPDSRRIALVRENGDLLVYDLATGQPSRHWRGPKPGMLSFRPDGAQIAALSDEKGSTCRILETETGRLIRSIPMRAKAIGVQWSPDGATLTTTCVDRRIDLWDAASGTLKVTLQGHTHGGLGSTFHPAGTLLASNGWEKRLFLWDPVLGRSWLNLPGDSNHQFSSDGRITVSFEHQLTTYEVDPALEYRTFAHAGRDPNEYGEVSIRSDGRVLALGTNGGVSLWDLACGRELAFLRIGYAVSLLFEASGDLLTSGPIGVWRWPVRLDPEGREFRIGPPSRLPLPAGIEQIAEDRSGRIVALAGLDFTHILTAERTFQVGPLEQVKSVAVSPEGEYVATGCHGTTGAQVWRLRDSAKLAHQELEGFTSVKFSPDGKWLMIENSPCRLLETGTWREVRRLKGRGRCFSPDARLVVVMDPNKVLELVEAETGRILARLTSPDLGEAWAVTFSPDGSKLVVSTRDGPAVHVWDLRAIRRRLVVLGLDWDAPAYSEEDPAGFNAACLPPLQIDYGLLAGRIRRSTE
jgi:WD40 repeat protein